MSENKKGKLYIFTSYTPGAGKSYRMVATACEQEENVTVGFLNSAHRDIFIPIIRFLKKLHKIYFLY